MSDAETKRCHGPCGQVRAIAMFHVDNSRPDGRSATCKLCWIGKRKPSTARIRCLNCEEMMREPNGFGICRRCQREIRRRVPRILTYEFITTALAKRNVQDTEARLFASYLMDAIEENTDLTGRGN